MTKRQLSKRARAKIDRIASALLSANICGFSAEAYPSDEFWVEARVIYERLTTERPYVTNDTAFHHKLTGFVIYSVFRTSMYPSFVEPEDHPVWQSLGEVVVQEILSDD